MTGKDSSPARGVALLVTAFVAVFVASSGTHALTPLFPELKRALGVDDGSVRLLTSVFTLGYSISGFVLGVTCDRIGRRRVLLGSLAGYAAANALLLLDVGWAGFLVCRAVAGLGTGGIVSAAVALVADSVPYAKRGRALAVVLGGGYAALVIGMPAAAALARVRLTALFGVLAVVSIACAIASAAPAARAVDRSEVAPISGVGLLSLPRAALACRGAPALLFTTFAFTAASFAVITSFADWCHDAFQSDLADRERFFLWLGLGALPGAFVAGACSDRLGKRRTVLLALGGSLVATPALLLADSFVTFATIAVAVSAIAAVRQGPFAAILTGLGPETLRGSLVGLNSAASGLGLATGTWLGGVLYGVARLSGAVWAAVVILLLGSAVFFARVAAPAAPSPSPAEPATRAPGVEETAL